MSKISNRKLILWIGLVITSYILTMIASNGFFIILTERQQVMYVIFRIVEMIVIGVFWALVIKIVTKLKEKDKKTKSFLKYFATYFAIMIIFWLLTWPGIFKGDEFYIIPANIVLYFNYMQHYLWSSFYIICFMIFPAMATITFMQLLIISSMVGYGLAMIEPMFKHKKLTWLFFIPLLLLPVIDNNLFPLRHSIITYLFLLLILKLWVIYKNKKKEIGISKVDYIEMMVLISIVGALKTEYLSLIIIVPIILKYVFDISMKKMMLAILTMIVLTCFINIPQRNPSSNTYILTSMINPISTIISNDNAKGITQEDMDKINKVINYNKLKQGASYINIPVYFAERVDLKVITAKEKIDFILTYVKIVMNNIDLFLENRWTMFAYTSGMIKDYINHTGHENANYTLKLSYNSNKVRDYINYSEPIFSQEIREKVIKIINCRNLEDYTKTNSIYSITYNVLPQIIGLAIILIYNLIKKNRIGIAISGICIVQFVLIFLTVPAAFWMYYMPIYMSGNMVITYIIVSAIDKRMQKPSSAEKK